MLVSELFEEIRNEANTNSAKASDDYLLTGINIDYGELVMLALKARGDHNFQIEESYTDLISTSGLTAGQSGYNGEYSWPTDLIRPIRAEVSFDGSTYNQCTVYDISDNRNTSEFNATQINGTFGEQNPYIRFERNSYFIRPLKTTAGNITGGIHIWYEKRQTALTESDTPAIEPNFHRLLALMGTARLMRKFRKEYSVNDRNEIYTEIAKLKSDFSNFYSNQVQENINLTPIPADYS